VENWQLVLAVSCILVGFGVLLLFYEKNENEMLKYWKQVVGMVFIMPVILVLSSLSSIDSDTVSVLLGIVVGYFFRMAQTDSGPDN
jgi:xanthine/uracil permease